MSVAAEWTPEGYVLDARRVRPMVLAIDPGPVTSGWVRFDGERVVAGEPEMPNEDVLALLRETRGRHAVAVEWITSYGMAVGADVFETCAWVGRFVETAGQAERIARRDIKAHLCGSAKARDANVRQALIDRFGGVAGKQAAVGRKASPGPLYGCRSHMWAALAVAVTWWDKSALAQRNT